MADSFTPYSPQTDPHTAGGNPILTALSNTPGSVARQVGGMAQAAVGMVPQPRIVRDGQGNIDHIAVSVPTMEAIGHVMGGLWGHLTGQEVSPESKAAGDAFINHFKSYYGSPGALKQALVDDPAGVAMDVASVAAPIEGGVKAAGMLASKAGLSSVARFMEQGAKVAGTINDYTNPLSAISKGSAPIRGATAQRIYETALRPTTQEDISKIPAAAAEGLRSGVRGGEKTNEDIWAAMRQPMAQVDQAVANRTQQGATVNLGRAIQTRVGSGLQVPAYQATDADLVAAGPVYRKYMGAERAKQASTIDDTINDIENSWGYPGSGPTKVWTPAPGAPPAPNAAPPTPFPSNAPQLAAGPQTAVATETPAFPLGSPGAPPNANPPFINMQQRSVPGQPPGLGPVPFDVANRIKKSTYRDVEQARKSAAWDERTGPRLDTLKGFAGGIASDMRQQAPELEAPLNRESNLMALDDLMNPSKADLAASARTLGFSEKYSAARALMAPSVKTRIALGMNPGSPYFGAARAAGGAASDVAAPLSRAAGINLNNSPALDNFTPSSTSQQPDSFQPIQQFAQGGAVLNGPSPALVGEAGPEVIQHSDGTPPELVEGPQVRTLGTTGTDQVVPLTKQRAQRTPEQLALDEQSRFDAAKHRLDAQFNGFAKKNKWPIPPGTLSDQQNLQYQHQLGQLQDQLKQRLAAIKASQAQQAAQPPVPALAGGGVVNMGQSGQDVIRGSSNIPLAPEGEQDALKIAGQLPGVFNAIYSSDLLRAQQTAQALSQTNPQAGPPQLLAGLRPWHLGQLEGQPTDQVVDTINDYIKNHPDQVIPGRGPLSTADGESFNSFAQRATGALNGLLDQQASMPGSRIAAVTHYRDLKLANALSNSPDGQLDPETMTAHSATGDAPTSIHRLTRTAHGGMHVSSVKPQKNLPEGVYLIRHGKTALNGETRGKASTSGPLRVPKPPSVSSLTNRRQQKARMPKVPAVKPTSFPGR